MTDHPLDHATRLQRLDDGRFRAATSQDYANFTGFFGGATAAALMRAVMDHPQRTENPVAFTMNFTAALRDGEFDIAVKLQRTGKYTQHWSLEVEQGGIVTATASLVCGARGDVFTHQPAPAPAVPSPGDCAVMDTAMMPPWTKCYEFRPIEGRVELSRTDHDPLRDPKSLHWVRDCPDRKLDHTALAGLADTFILRMLYVRGRIAPLGTVSMTTYFHASEAEIARHGSAPLLGWATAGRFNGNFHDQPMMLWASDGTLLASGTQLVWYKD